MPIKKVENFTVVGNPTITDGVVSGFSTSNYLSIESPVSASSSKVLEVYMKITLPSSYSSNMSFFSRADADRGIYVQNSSKCFGFYDGSSRITTITATAGKTYWIAYSRTSAGASTLSAVEDDGTYTLQTLPRYVDTVFWAGRITWTSGENTFGGKNINIGANISEGTSLGSGSVYLDSIVIAESEQGDLAYTAIWEPYIEKEVGGSVSISKGIYKDSRGTIILSNADYSVSALTSGQTVGCKNKLFAYSNGVSSGALLTSLPAPTGATVYADLEHPVYLDHTKQYIAGDTLKDPTMAYQTAANNYTVHGSVSIVDGITQTPLTNTNYIENSNGVFAPGTNAWEFATKITTPASLGTDESMIVCSDADQRGFRIGWQYNSNGQRWQFLVSSGSRWINTNNYYSTSYTVQPSTTYWIKAGCQKNAQNYTYYLKFSLDGVNYTDNVSYTSGSTMGGYQMRLGPYRSGYSFNGTLDLTETSLTSAGSLWWKALQIEGLTVSDCLVYDDSTDTTYWKVNSSTSDVLATAETLKHYNPIRLSNASGIEAVPTLAATGYDTGKALYTNNPKTAPLGIDNPYAFNMSQAVSSTSVADYTAIGAPTASESMLEGFSASDYVTATNTIGGPRNAFEFKFFTVSGDGSNTIQSLVNFNTSTGCYGVYINNGTTLTVGKRSGQITTFALEGVVLQQTYEGIWVRCKRTPTAFSAEIVEDPNWQYSRWEDIPESAWVSIGSIGVDASEASDTIYLGNDAGFTSYYYTGSFYRWGELMKWLSPALKVIEWTPYQAEAAGVVWAASDWSAIGPDVASGDYRVYSTVDVESTISPATLWTLSLGSQKRCANLVAFNTSDSAAYSNVNCLGTGYESSSYAYPSYDYTGYRVYFDSTYSVVTNVEQYGQKCKIFKNGTGYVALKDSEGSNPTKAYTATSTAPIYNLVIDYPSNTESFVYDSTANTVTIEGIVFTYVGSCLANV